MLADATLDTIVTLSWVGVLAVVLLAQAFVGWMGHRYVTKSARMAERLARATAPPSVAAASAPVPTVAVTAKPHLEVMHGPREATG